MTALCFPPVRQPIVPRAPALSPRAMLAPARRVGLLGGSFNPAHGGHRYISIEALKRLGLDEVWWLVSPQNPLKARQGMAPLAERLATAAAVADHPHIRARALEDELGTRYTVDTLDRLRHWPGFRFVWLLGADNLAQLPRWRQWERIVATCPIAVFERQPYSYPALAGAAATRLAGARLPDASARALVATEPPAWLFLRLRPHPASATSLRARRGGQQSAPRPPSRER